MSKILQIQLYRILQISFVITFCCWLAMYFHIAHGYWIPFTAAIIYGPINEANVAIKMKERIFGTIMGLLLCFILGSFAKIHSEFIYPIYFGLYFFIFLNLPRYFFAVIFITTFVIWDDVFIAVGSLNLEHLILDRFYNTMAGAAIVCGFEYIFIAYWQSERLIHLIYQKRQFETFAFCIKALRSINDNMPFKEQENLKMLRKQSFEIDDIVSKIPFSFFKSWSKQSKAYDKALQQWKEVRSELMVIEYLRQYHSKETKDFITRNPSLFNYIFALPESPTPEQLQVVYSLLKTAKLENEIDQHLIKGLISIQQHVIAKLDLDVNSELTEEPAPPG